MLSTHFPGQANLGGFHSIDALLGIREEMRNSYVCQDPRGRVLPENTRVHDPGAGPGKYHRHTYRLCFLNISNVLIHTPGSQKFIYTITLLMITQLENVCINILKRKINMIALLNNTKWMLNCLKCSLSETGLDNFI